MIVVAFAVPDGKHVACGGFDGFVGVYDVETGSLVHKYEGVREWWLCVYMGWSSS